MDISRILLPEQITRSVFSRMKQTRQRFAQNARSEGKAIAQGITAETNSDKQRILAFADRVAQNTRAQGDAAAAQYYAEYNKDPEFALFLRKLEALEKSLKTNTTFVLDTDSEPFDLLKE
jgi:membrane protease subunit HflC